MDFNEYQQAAVGTAIYPEDMRVVYPALGLAGETGEVVDKVKKTIRDHGRDFGDEATRQALAKELGDVLWYLSAIAHDLGYSLEEIATMNVAKILSRQQRDKLHGEGDDR